MQFSNPVSHTHTRVEWIDTAKALGIILVVLGHTYDIPHWLYCLIYGFHMPLFFLLSGLTYRYDPNISFGNYVIKLAKAYLLPYITLAFINLILHSLWLLYLGQLNLHIIGRFLVGTLYCYATMEWMPNCSPLWFLCAIFLSKFFLFLFYRLFHGNKFRISCAIVICGLIAWLLSLSTLPRLPWNILPAMMGSIFLWTGHLLRENKEFLSRGWSRATILPILLSLALSPWLMDNVPGMNQNFYDNVLLFLISGFGGSFLLILLSTQIKRISFLTNFVGKHTVILMGFNYFARTFAVEFYYLIPVVRKHLIHPLVAFILTLLALFAITWIYIRFIEARRKRSYAA